MRNPHRLLVLASVGAVLLPAQNTPRDAGGYTVSPMSYSAREIISDGASRILQSTDEDSVQVPLGFTFSFYGQNYDRLCISTNGVLSFGRCVESPVNVDMTVDAPDGDVPVIAAFWADLTFENAAADAVYYLTQGEAGKRLFVVQWNKAMFCCGEGPAVTFQAVLAEETGDITLNYMNVAPADANLGGGLPATIGIRDAGGQSTGSVSQWSHRVSAVQNSMTIRFSRPAQLQLPSITAVTNAAGAQPEVAANTWFAINGINLSGTTRLWADTDFAGNQLPLALDAVSVTVNGKPAAVYYISPTQVNALAPDDDSLGDVSLRVYAAQGNARSTVRRVAFSPALFLYGGTQIAIVQSTSYALLGPPESLSYVVRPARPREQVILWATGLGPTNPATPALQVSPAAPLANAVTVTIGGIAVTPDYVGQAGPGLYQLNVTIPDGLNGSVPISASVGGATSPAGITIPVRP